MNSMFTIFALAACLGAVAVVVSQSIARMAFWLIVSLGSVAGLFFLADADFVGATQLLIYVGGTLVLLVFGIMLTASGPYMKIETSPAETMVAGLIGLLFLFMVSPPLAVLTGKYQSSRFWQRPVGRIRIRLWALMIIQKATL